MSDHSDNVLSGKWTFANNHNQPGDNISVLMQTHETLAIADATLALRQSANDFMAQYRIIEASSLDTMEQVENIETAPNNGGFDFPYARILADLRETETRTGIYGHFDINDLFQNIYDTNVFDPAFQSQKCAEYIRQRQQAAWRATSELKRFRAAYADNNNTETPATKISKSTNIALNILTHNWMKKRPVGEYTYGPFMHNIGQLAQNFIDPTSKDFAYEIISYEAQRFVKELPYLKSRAEFTKMINAHLRKDHDRIVQGHIGEHQTVVPIPFKPEYPEF